MSVGYTYRSAPYNTMFILPSIQLPTIKIVDGIPEVVRPDYVGSKPSYEALVVTIPKLATSEMTKHSDPNTPVTIAASGWEVSVLGGHFDTQCIRPDDTKKVYLAIHPCTMCQVDEWMEVNLPHFVAYTANERVIKSEERRWINANATGRWSLSWVSNGIRFAEWKDAFAFKMART